MRWTLRLKLSQTSTSERLSRSRKVQNLVAAQLSTSDQETVPLYSIQPSDVQSGVMIATTATVI